MRIYTQLYLDSELTCIFVLYSSIQHLVGYTTKLHSLFHLYRINANVIFILLIVLAIWDCGGSGWRHGSKCKWRRCNTHTGWIPVVHLTCRLCVTATLHLHLHLPKLTSLSYKLEFWQFDIMLLRKSIKYSRSPSHGWICCLSDWFLCMLWIQILDHHFGAWFWWLPQQMVLHSESLLAFSLLRLWWFWW